MSGFLITEAVAPLNTVGLSFWARGLLSATGAGPGAAATASVDDMAGSNDGTALSARPTGEVPPEKAKMGAVSGACF